MAVSFKDDSSQFKEHILEIQKLAESYVLVGFQEGSVTQSQVKGNRRKKGGKSMAEIAAYNEFGTEDIPARPFMSTSFEENKDKISRVIQNEYNKVLDGKSNVKKSLDLIGLYMTDLIQTKIRAIHYPPNSPRTIRAKKSSHPLIDFGQMIQSVRHKTVIK